MTRGHRVRLVRSLVAVLVALTVLTVLVGAVTVTPRPAAASSALGPGAVVGPGGWLSSPNGAYRLTPQTDGNLVLYGPTGAVWWTGTSGGAGTLVMQGDGNLVLYGPSGPMWHTGTNNVATNTTLLVQDDGNVVLYSPEAGALWSRVTGSIHDAMWSGFVLGAGQRRVSQGALYQLLLQGDGNVVIYGPAGPVWWTGTDGSGADRLVMQGDGNLVLYRGASPLWSSGTYNNPGASARLQLDGALVISRDGLRVWASGGSGRRATATALDAATRQALQTNGTWNAGCPVTLDDLVTLRFPYTDRGGVARWGTMYINRDAVAAVAQATEDMDAARFPIWEYGGFRCEMMSSGRWSEHAYGRAVDFNWTVNPYYNGSSIVPAGSGAYLDRSRNEPGMFYADSVGVQSFARHGWGWGGAWTYNNGQLKDYMHFSWNNR